MAMERWRQVKELLQSALEQQPDNRSAFLDKVCAGDSSLRSEVESLIEHHKLADNFLKSPIAEIQAHLSEHDLTPHLNGSVNQDKVKPDSVGDATSDTGSDPLIGRTLGEFTILEKLGEGGFGAVYRAQQFTLGREA